MSEYYRILKDLLDTSGVAERRTETATGREALFRNGVMIAGEEGRYDLVETIRTEPVLFLFGCGHVGKALYDLGVLQGMRMIILDDRPELLTEERFPEAERHTGPFNELLKRDYNAPSPYFVIFTHGHEFDKDALRYALSHSHSYIGMIGSKRKAAAQIQALREEGFPEEELQAVHSPVGVSINAVTPEEIAISIMAEIISVFRQDRNTITADQELLEALQDTRGVLMRIISKEGSAPRGEGTMMFVTENKEYSTIGGGAVEQLAVRRARELLKEGKKVEINDYGLVRDGNTGMICGGNVRILFKLIE